MEVLIIVGVVVSLVDGADLLFKLMVEVEEQMIMVEVEAAVAIWAEAAVPVDS